MQIGAARPLTAGRGGGLALSKAVKMGKKSRRQREKGLSHSEGNKVINPNSVPPFIGHEFGLIGVDSGGVCATSVPILRTSPSRVTWFVVGVAWRATAPKSATSRIGRSTRRNAAAVGWLSLKVFSLRVAYPRKKRRSYGRRLQARNLIVKQQM